MRSWTILYGASLVETIEVAIWVVIRIVLYLLAVAAICIIAIEAIDATEVTIAMVSIRWCRSWRRRLWCWRRWYRLCVPWSLMYGQSTDTTSPYRVLDSSLVSCLKASLQTFLLTCYELRRYFRSRVVTMRVLVRRHGTVWVQAC